MPGLFIFSGVYGSLVYRVGMGLVWVYSNGRKGLIWSRAFMWQMRC